MNISNTSLKINLIHENMKLDLLMKLNAKHIHNVVKEATENYE